MKIVKNYRFGSKRAIFTQNGPNLLVFKGKKWPSLGQKWPSLGQKWPSYGQKWPIFDQTCNFSAFEVK